LAKIQDPLALMANSNNPYASPATHQDLSLFDQNYLQQPMPNPEDITDPTTIMNMALSLMAKAFKLNYSTPTNNNQRISSNPRNRQIAQPAGHNGNQIRCYNCRGEEAGIQRQAEEYDLLAVAADLDKIEEVNANSILMANLQQASSSGTQTDSTPVYDTDGSVEVHENYDNNEIFNMFTQEEQYTELLEPIPEPQQQRATSLSDPKELDEPDEAYAIMNDRYKTGEGYHVVPLLYTGTFLPLKPNLVFTDDSNASESVANVFNVESSTNKPSKDMSKTHRPAAHVSKIEFVPKQRDWISDSDSEDESKIEFVPKQREPSIVKSSEHVKSSRESKDEHPKQASNLMTNNQKSRGHKKK
nr:hypothetical protein [Tanacetum cinerariifolium]